MEEIDSSETSHSLKTTRRYKQKAVLFIITAVTVSKPASLLLIIQADSSLAVYELFVYFQSCNLRIILVVVLLVFPLSSSIPDNLNLKDKIVFLPHRNAMKMYSTRQSTAIPFCMKVSGQPHTSVSLFPDKELPAAFG
jgi:hypothetical protein